MIEDRYGDCGIWSPAITRHTASCARAIDAFRSLSGLPDPIDSERNAFRIAEDFTANAVLAALDPSEK